MYARLWIFLNPYEMVKTANRTGCVRDDSNESSLNPITVSGVVSDENNCIDLFELRVSQWLFARLFRAFVCDACHRLGNKRVEYSLLWNFFDLFFMVERNPLCDIYISNWFLGVFGIFRAQHITRQFTVEYTLQFL